LVYNGVALEDDMLTGFTPPYTSTGRSSLAVAPPWHYAGQVLSLSFPVDDETANALLPVGFGRSIGSCAGHFCEWQATTDGSELTDPVYAQYKEFLVLIEAERNGEHVNYCPFIYVDQDISMVRGRLQGLPKKSASVWMTRSYDLDHVAAASMRRGTAFGASLAVKDRRIAEARVTLTGEAADAIGFLARRTYGLIGSPSVVGGPSPGVPKLVRADVSHKVQGPAFAATGTLAFFDSPRDELALLQPTGPAAASVSTFALTVSGAIEA